MFNNFLNQFLEKLPSVPEYQRILKPERKKRGQLKFRVCYRPNEAMEIIQCRLVRNLRKLSENRFQSATGGRPGYWTGTNAIIHRRMRYFYLLDFEKAFPSVDLLVLAQVWCALERELFGQTEQVHLFLKSYCSTPAGGLCTGANASTDFFNIYAGVLVDDQLDAFCRRRGIRYSRFIDDLSFSSKRPIGKRTRRRIREIIAKAGFKVKNGKSRYVDIAKTTVAITGIGIKNGGEVFVPKSYLRQVMRFARITAADPFRISRPQRSSATNFERLEGMMHYILSIEHPQNRRIGRLIAKYSHLKYSMRLLKPE